MLAIKNQLTRVVSAFLTIQATAVVVEVGGIVTALAQLTFRVEVFELQPFGLSPPLLLLGQRHVGRKSPDRLLALFRIDHLCMNSPSVSVQAPILSLWLHYIGLFVLLIEFNRLLDLA